MEHRQHAGPSLWAHSLLEKNQITQEADWARGRQQGLGHPGERPSLLQAVGEGLGPGKGQVETPTLLVPLCPDAPVAGCLCVLSSLVLPLALQVHQCFPCWTPFRVSLSNPGPSPALLASSAPPSYRRMTSPCQNPAARSIYINIPPLLELECGKAGGRSVGLLSPPHTLSSRQPAQTSVPL